MKSNKITKPIANVVGAGPVSALNHRGITLIALIITIIVMLILVGVSITIAINGGLFDTTKRAAKETEEAKRKEQELASGRIKIDEIWYDSLEDYAIGKQSEIQGIVDLDKNNTKFKYTPEGWTNGEVKVGIDASSVSTGYILKYSTDNITWRNYTEEITMSTNGTIYVKLVDSDGKEGGAVTANVANIDKELPKINTNVTKAGEETDTTIPLGINVTDEVSGISKIKWYYKSETENTFKEDIYETIEKGTVTKETILTGLTPLSTYNIYAEVYDVAGNSTRSPETGTINVTTKKEAVKPQIGDYVLYEPDLVTDAYELLGKYSGYGNYNNSSLPATQITVSDQSIAQEKLDWQVLKVYDDGRIDLIGTPTTNAVYFAGSLGYNNGVYLLHDICKELYSKPSKEIEARSVSLEDFEDEDNGGNWKSVRDAYPAGRMQYGGTKTFTGDGSCYYPNLYAREKGSGIDKEVVKTDGIKVTDKGYERPTEETYSKANTNVLTITENGYAMAVIEPSYGASTKVLKNQNAYWIAARCAIRNSEVDALFCLWKYNGQNILYDWLMDSNVVCYTKNSKLRPVVTLKSSTKLNISEEGTNGEPNTFEIINY